MSDTTSLLRVIISQAHNLPRSGTAQKIVDAAEEALKTLSNGPKSDGTTLEQQRARFGQWYSMARPLFEDGGEKLKHQLWTAWQIAHDGTTPKPQSERADG